MFAVGHYFKSRTGSRRITIPDPEVVLVQVQDVGWIPLSRRTPFGSTTVASIGDTGLVVHNEGELTHLLELVNAWLLSVQTNLLGGALETERRAREETKMSMRPIYLAS